MLYQARSQSEVLLNSSLAACGVAPLDQAASLACMSRLALHPENHSSKSQIVTALGISSDY
jgi:hypothetical protein